MDTKTGDPRFDEFLCGLRGEYADKCLEKIGALEAKVLAIVTPGSYGNHDSEYLLFGGINGDNEHWFAGVATNDSCVSHCAHGLRFPADGKDRLHDQVNCYVVRLAVEAEKERSKPVLAGAVGGGGLSSSSGSG